MPDPFGIKKDKPERRVSEKDSGSLLGNLVVMIAVAFVAFVVWQKLIDNDIRPTPPIDDDKEQVDPDDEKKDDKKDGQDDRNVIDWTGLTLYSVIETKPISADVVSMTATLKKFANDNSMRGSEFFDDDLPEMKSIIDWAKNKGVSPPFTVLLDSSKKPLGVIPFPKTLADLEKLK